MVVVCGRWLAPASPSGGGSGRRALSGPPRPGRVVCPGMNAASRSDASTSTDDVQGRPLCLFYFTHPFAVLSPEAPCVYDMESAPPPPFCWPPPASDSYRSSSRTPPAPAPVPPPEARRGRYARILPPLRVPSPRDLVDYSSDDVWPPRPLAARFSLPPLVLPPPAPPALPAPIPPPDPGEQRARRPRPSPAGVDQHRRRHRRARAGDLRRLLTHLIRRTITEGRVCRESSASASASCSPAPALRRALHTLRDAWAPPVSSPPPAPPLAPQPAPPHYRSAVFSEKLETSKVSRYPESVGMSRGEGVGGAGRADASPGLLRRRYSVPETIMRKYRLAQQFSESEEGASCARHSAGSASASESPRRLRRDRELMRKSALLRRLWGGGGGGGGPPTPACACCDLRSETELRRSPPAWSSPERRRLAVPSDSTFESHAGDACSCIDAFTDVETPAPPTTEAPLISDDRSYSDSDPFSTSLSTAKEMAAHPHRRFLTESIERRVFERSTFDGRDDRNPVPYDRVLAVDTSASPYELLEIVVSETMTDVGAPPPTPPTEGTGTAPSAPDLDIDRYVSNILVESLNSLSDQLECMNASIGNDRKISIVEKEIKVRLQNTGVNTIVHLSPTSNNQIIFGNEELCNETTARDECNNPLATIRDDAGTPTAPVAPPLAQEMPPAFDALQHDSVNEAVLQQIQKLFRDELRHLGADDADDAISHVEISNAVDVYVERRADLIGGVGAGNYFCDSRDAAVVPRFSAFPHTDSMEVNTSSSEEVELAGSECTSLVDSLDDPNSPRPLGFGADSASARRRALVRSAIDVLDLLPEREPRPEPEPEPAPARDKPEAFFVRIEEDRIEPDSDDVRVAEYMPETIKQRLYRRHRKRELRMECARRGKNQLKREIELRRHEDAAAAEARRRGRLDRDCRPIVDELLDDVIAKVVHDEFKRMRTKRRNRLQGAKSDETLSRRTRKVSLDSRRTSLEAATEQERCRRLPEPSRGRSDRDGSTGRHQVHGKLLGRPSPSLASRPPRRFYQKSEIHEGDKCIEILEILEYVHGSQSSPETANSDESHGRGSRSKKSRIPVPVYERTHHRSIGNGGDHMRLTGGDGRRSRAAAASGDDGGALAELLLEALAEGPAEPRSRSRSSSLRFRRVFDMIPEERSSLSVESPASEEERGSRSAATSPPPGAAPHRLRHQLTMTSPYNKSAGTSPIRPPPPPREGYREVGVGPIESPAVAAAVAVAIPRDLPDGDRNEKRDEATVSVSGERGPTRTRAGSPDRERGAGAGRGRHEAPPAPEGDSSDSDSGDSGGSLLCSLAPRWLTTQARRDRRRDRRRAPPHPAPANAPAPAPHAPDADAQLPTGAGGWSVTVAGSCRAALPHDVEMRLRFPHAGPPELPVRPECAECACVQCAACAARAAARAPRPALPPPSARNDPSLTLTMKKEAQDSSIVASKTSRRSREHLPELETYRASRTKVKSSMKTRRGYSLHCWLPDGGEPPPPPLGGSSELSVLGCAIVPELKPRVPTMSERDLTRVYTPRHYLRS